MAEEKIEIHYTKSPQWRAVAATAVSINAIGGPVGLEFLMRFTFEWVDVEKEVATAEVNMVAGNRSYTIKTAPQAVITPLRKIEEMAVRMPAEGAASFVAAMLTQFSHLQGTQKLTDQQKKKISDAFAKLQAS